MSTTATRIDTWTEDVHRHGHFDVVMKGITGVTATGSAWATAMEMDATGSHPISGGAHVTVQQVVPGNGEVTVRVWVDNVPADINVRVTLFVPFTIRIG